MAIDFGRRSSASLVGVELALANGSSRASAVPAIVVSACGGHRPQAADFLPVAWK